MPLHPQVAAFIKKVNEAGGKPFRELGIENGRKAYVALQTSLPSSQQQLAAVMDQPVPGPAGPVPTRVYTPQGSGPFPLMVYLHGGGWVIGNIDSHDKICRELCGAVGMVVVSVDYRLAPEHKFPAGLEDSVTVTQWVLENAAAVGGDPKRIAIGGDSAGGNLAAAVALRLRGTGPHPLAAQYLPYPCTRLDGVSTPSMIDNAYGYRLERPDMEWFRSHYLAAEDHGLDPLASPLLARELANLPPTLIQTCEYDPLRDEGEDYGRLLQTAGVPTTVSRYDGAIHGSLNLFTVLEPGRRMMDEAIRWLKERLGTAAG